MLRTTTKITPHCEPRFLRGARYGSSNYFRDAMGWWVHVTVFGAKHKSKNKRICVECPSAWQTKPIQSHREHLLCNACPDESFWACSRDRLRTPCPMTIQATPPNNHTGWNPESSERSHQMPTNILSDASMRPGPRNQKARESKSKNQPETYRRSIEHTGNKILI